MKIAVDAGGLGVIDERLKVGVYQVIKNLLIELGKTDKKNTYLLYSFQPIERKLLNQFGLKTKNIVVKPAFGWMKFALPLQLLFDKPDVFIAASQAMPTKLPGSVCKTIGLFYDIAFEKYPELYSYAASVERHRNFSRKLAIKADMLVAISNSTKSDLIHYYHISPKKIFVAHPGIREVHDSKHRKAEATYKHPYFLFVGAFKKSKNIPTLLQAFENFSKKTKKTYDLRLVGGDKWFDPKIEKTLLGFNDEIKSHIIQMGFVADEQLLNLYKNAIAFVSPSWAEGFGLTFLEAQQAGCPVIASNRPSLPEILDDSAILVSPNSAQELSKAMQHITKSKSARLRLIQKGKINVQRYSWKMFAKTVQSAIGLLNESKRNS